jgi:purine-binding chemotaxis protein CheW
MQSDVATLSEFAAQRMEQRAGRHLAFRLGQEEFAIPVVRVRQIMGVQNFTAAPQTPPYVKGVINLRGKVIPVVDLRLKFGMPEQDYTIRTCMVIIETEQDGARMLSGVVVDEVSGTLTVEASDIENLPDFEKSAPYLVGMAKRDGEATILLDMDLVLRRDLLT